MASVAEAKTVCLTAVSRRSRTLASSTVTSMWKVIEPALRRLPGVSGKWKFCWTTEMSGGNYSALFSDTFNVT